MNLDDTIKEARETISKLRRWAKNEYEYENRATGTSTLFDDAADTIEGLIKFITKPTDRACICDGFDVSCDVAGKDCVLNG